MAIIRKMKSKPKSGDTYDVIVEVEDDSINQVETVNVYIPKIVGQPIPSSTNVNCTYDTTEEGIKYYVGTVDFNPSAVGLTYEMTGTMKDNKGNQVGDQKTEEVEIQEAEAAA